MKADPVLDSVESQRGVDLDPNVREFIRITGEAYAVYGKDRPKTIESAREVAESVRAPWILGGPVMAETREIDVTTRHGPVRLRLHRPTGAATPQPALFYVHGGGWVMFSLDTHDRVMREYAGRSGVTVIGIDYARSPEARFPVALEQIVDVIAHAVSFADALGIDANRLTIGGDSAGANLSVAAALTLRDDGHGDRLKGLLLNYGAYAPELKREDVVRYGGPDYMLTDAEMAYFWDQYLTAPADGDNPLAAPLKADLRGLPPAFLAIPECDVLTGQSHDLYDRLIEAGVRARAVTYAGASHSFLEAVSIAPIADQALADASLWLRTLVEMPS